MVDVRMYSCPQCGAPLPAAGEGTQVTCGSCRKQTSIDSGSDAVLAEQRSRAEAEALYAKLGRPPRWSQRAATYLVSWKLWVIGFPFLIGILVSISQVPENWVQGAYEHLFHARLMHVASPVVAQLLSRFFIVVISIGLLVWSLLGERIDARRDLQAMLAAKPPLTSGGASRCRQCAAPLEVTAGALGTRCDFCGADNLLVLPPAWIARARKSNVELRLTMKLARERAQAGQRRMLSAALWRAPLVLVLLMFLVLPAISARHIANWSDMRSDGVVLYTVEHKQARGVLRATSTCARHKNFKESSFDTLASKDCDQLGCQSFAMIPLRRGEILHAIRSSPGDVAVRIALAPRYTRGPGGCWEDCGDNVLHEMLPNTELSQRIEITGWYLVHLFSRSHAAVAVELCVD
jgi:hypothetical protein